MVYCIRCSLHRALRIVNIVVTSIGIGMIAYSLWLLKRWKDDVADWDFPSGLPQPWFVYTCLAIGIVACLSMLFGHVVATRMNTVTLSIYILAVCFILLCQFVLVVLIFFKINWEYDISDEFKDFLSTHLAICRLIGITILFAQASVLVLAIVLWVLGPEPITHCSGPAISNLRYSFLVSPESQVNTFPSTSILPTFRYRWR